MKVKSSRISLSKPSNGLLELPDLSPAHASSCQIFMRLRIPQRKDIKGPSVATFKGLPAAGSESKSEQLLVVKPGSISRNVQVGVAVTLSQALSVPLLLPHQNSTHFSHRLNPRDPLAPSASERSSATTLVVAAPMSRQETINESSTSEYPCTPSSIRIRSSDADVGGRGSLGFDLLIEDNNKLQLLPPDLPMPSGHPRSQSKARLASTEAAPESKGGGQKRQESFTVHENGSFSSTKPPRCDDC